MVIIVVDVAAVASVVVVVVIVVVVDCDGKKTSLDSIFSRSPPRSGKHFLPHGEFQSFSPVRKFLRP